jgi:hypothetical protein
MNGRRNKRQYDIARCLRSVGHQAQCDRHPGEREGEQCQHGGRRDPADGLQRPDAAVVRNLQHESVVVPGYRPEGMHGQLESTRSGELQSDVTAGINARICTVVVWIVPGVRRPGLLAPLWL